MRRCSYAAAAVMYMLGVVATMHAQSVQGAISVTGGSATDVAGITSHAVTVTPSLTLSTDPHAAFSLSGSATRFANQQWSASGDLGAALRAPLSPHAAATLNASGTAAATSYDFSYRSAGLLPALEMTAGPITVYGGARVAGASTMASVQLPQVSRGPFGAPTVKQSSPTISRASLGALGGASMRFASGGETVLLGARVEQAHIDSIAQLDRMVTLTSISGPLSLNGALGIRSEPGVRTMLGSVGASLAVMPSTSIEASAGSYPADHLIGTPAGHFLSLGAAVRVGRSPATTTPTRQPRAEGAPEAPAGMTRLTISADDATRIDIVGDFTNWQPIAAHRAPNGVWYVDLRVPPGQYRYAFRANGTGWLVPAGVEVVDDDFGGKAAWLVVSTPGSNAR